jgi:serine/threonine protein kinase
MEHTKDCLIDEKLPCQEFPTLVDSSSTSDILEKMVADSSKEAITDNFKVISLTNETKTLSSSSSFKPSRSLVEILLEISSFPEFLAKSVFKGILKELEKLHSEKRYHGNLALENISITWDHEIILSDSSIEEKTFNEGVQVDMFCLGEILFALLAGFLPFTSEEDPNFVYFLEENWESFWSAYEKILLRPHHLSNFFKLELRDLIADLLSMRLDPELMITQLNDHLWLQGTEMSLKQTGELLCEVRKKMNKKGF